MPRFLRPLLLALPLLFGAAAAWAHASLLDTAPPDGAALEAAPPALVLRFDESVTPLFLHLVGPQGEVNLAAPATGATLRATLPPDLPAGTYLAGWRVVSEDGHPIGGTLAFGIGAAPAATSPPDNTAGWTRAAEILRFLLYLAFALGAGGALFRALVAEPPAALRARLAVASLAGLAVAALAVGVQGGSLLAANLPAALLDPAAWRAARATTLFDRAAVTALGLALVAASLAGTGRTARLAGFLGAVVAATGLSLSGHAVTGGWTTRLLLIAHALTAAFWLGAFWPLRSLLAERGTGALPALGRFTAIAIPAVVALILTGAAQAALYLPDFTSLTATTYGWLVLGKAGGALLLLSLAALNRQRLTPALSTQRPDASRHLSRGIAAEMAVALVVLGLAAVLTMTPPHDATTHQHAEAAPGTRVATEAGKFSLLLEASPARAGQNRLTAWIAGADGNPATPPEVWIELSPPGSTTGGLRRRMQPQAPGHFVQEGPELAIPGHWRARIVLLVSDFEEAALELGLDIDR
jgi:copper transport protein